MIALSKLRPYELTMAKPISNIELEHIRAVDIL